MSTHGKHSVLKRRKSAEGNEAPAPDISAFCSSGNPKIISNVDGLLKSLLGAGISDERREESQGSPVLRRYPIREPSELLQ
jgi:hypothetical protein